MDIFYTNTSFNDGFGSQYQKILQTYIFCKIHNLNFVYTPFGIVEHNYNQSKRAQIQSILEEQGYLQVLKYASQFDSFYVLPELKSSLLR